MPVSNGRFAKQVEIIQRCMQQKRPVDTRPEATRKSAAGPFDYILDFDWHLLRTQPPSWQIMSIPF
jgi:hypothetical protein